MEFGNMSASYLIVYIVSFASLLTGLNGKNLESTLLLKLFKTYDPSSRPVNNVSSSVLVTFDIALNQIIDLHEAKEQLKTKVWLRMAWKDETLHWDPAQYDNVMQLSVKPSQIWKPDITLYQDVSEADSMSAYQQSFPVTISWQGKVRWTLPYVFSTSCGLDVRYFPYDEQQCPLQFGSWTYNKKYLDLVAANTHADLRYYVCNGEWTLIGVPVKRNEEQYVILNASTTFVDLTYTVIIRRMSLYYSFNLLFPCLAITAMAILVFCLPPESGEKVNLGVTVLLSLIVFLLLVAQSMPTQSISVPLAGEFFGATIILVALSTAFTVLNLNIHYRGHFGVEPSPFIRKIFIDNLATVVFMRKHVEMFRQQRAKTLRWKPKENCVETQAPDAVANSKEKSPSSLTEGLTVRSEGERHLQDIVSILQELRTGRQNKQEETCHRTEWALLAVVVDRLLFILFIVTITVVSLAIMLHRPQYSDQGDSPVQC